MSTLKPGARVLIASNLYLPNIGGVENSIRSIADDLASSGVTVDVVCSDLDLTANRRLPRSEVVGNANVHRYRRSTGGLAPLHDIIRMRRKLLGLRASGATHELVIARSQRAVIALWLSGFRRIAYVVPAVTAYQDAHLASGGWRDRAALRVNGWIQRLALRLASRNFVLSENMAKQVRRFARSAEVHLVQAGVDQRRFRPAGEAERFRLREELELPVRQRLALCVGRFAPVKGFEHAVRALRLLPHEYALVIVGDGPLRDQYVSIANRLGVSDRLILRPRTGRPEEYYRAADVFLFTSTQEAFGQVLLEATCSGLPVVAFKPSEGVETAAAEIYGDYPALVRWAELPDSESLAAAIVDGVAETASLDASREDFAGRYAWRRTVEQIEKGLE